MRPATRVYSVPRRFNILSIMVLTTLFAVGFAALRFANAPLPVYLYVGVQATLTLGVQMFWPNAPRASSVVSGAILLPLALYGAFFIESHGRRAAGPLPIVLCPLPFIVGAGMFIGYATGAFAAGVFLIVDKLEKLLQRKPASVASSGVSPFAATVSAPVTAELASPSLASRPSTSPRPSPSDPVPPG